MGWHMKKKSPIIGIMMMALGGSLMVSNAKMAQMTKEEREKLVKHNYKRYDDEPLNPRIKDPVLKGRSLICTIDGKPMIIQIYSDDALYCVEKGLATINVLANECLKVMDKQKEQASMNFDRNIQRDNEQSQGVALR